MRLMTLVCGLTLASLLAPAHSWAAPSPSPLLSLDLPDAAVVEACERAASQNVLAAVNPRVFPGYWCVCADGQGFGYGNTYPSLDGHQMTDALLALGQVDTVKLNWAYVRGFMRPNGQLPLAIFPANAGPDTNGGLYQHWVPGDPLRALAGPTYIQNADAIYRRTADRAWLAAEMPSVNLAADYLASLTDTDGRVRGAGYYVERPARIEYDGVAQCHAVDAFRRAAALNEVVGDIRHARLYRELAARIAGRYRAAFWRGDRFAEYVHPQRGPIVSHGYTDSDWSAVACGVASPQQVAALWPKLRSAPGFRYGGMPTGIATKPEAYEDWEFTTNDRMDLAAMGRVWYLECWARARMGDGDGMLDSIRRVCEVGRASGYYWRERYTNKGPHGAEKYCEYPANLIRIVERFLMGVEFGLDGTLTVAPTAPGRYWSAGFGQTIRWRGRTLSFRMRRGRLTGAYSGPQPQRIAARIVGIGAGVRCRVIVDGRASTGASVDGGKRAFVLPAAPPAAPCTFEVRAHAEPGRRGRGR